MDGGNNSAAWSSWSSDVPSGPMSARGSIEPIPGASGEGRADNNGGFEDGTEERPAKRRRHRAKPSCLPCQRRKTKCVGGTTDGEQCEGCHKRGEECTWAPPVPLKAPPDELSREFLRIKERLRILETQMANKQDKVDAFHLRVVSPQRPAASGPPPGPPTANTETEDAAQALEDVFLLGRRQYAGALALNSEVPPPQTSAASTFVVPGAFTSIFLLAAPSGPTVFRGVQSEAARLLKTLPDKAVSDALVNIFLSEISFTYHILHGPTFLDECEQLSTAIQNGNEAGIDPAWISCYFRVLAWGVSSVTYQLSLPPALSHYPASEIASLPSIWSAAADLALSVSSWAAKPQLRAVQAILLKISYERPGSQSAPGAAEGTSFFVWLAAAIRICQLMGYHRLGSDPQTMPPDDPGLPEGRCTLKRELAKRVWFFCLVHDWMFVSAGGMNQIGSNSYDTDPPLNLDEEDLGLTMNLPSHPPNYMAPYSYTLNLFVLAQFQRVATDLSQGRTPVGYHTILKLSAGLETEIRRLESLSFSNPRLKPYHKALLLAILTNRVLRLHRPFFMRGMHPDHPGDVTYSESVSASLRSAASVALSLQALGAHGHRPHLWFLPAYGIAAVIVLFMRLLQKEELGQDTGEERSLILAVRGFYSSGASLAPAASNSPTTVCLQACRIIDNLLSAERSNDSPAADIFREIASKIMLPAGPSGHPGVAPLPPTFAPTASPHHSGFSDPSQYHFAPSDTHHQRYQLQPYQSRTETYPAFSAFASPLVGREQDTGHESFDRAASHHALMSLATLEFPLSSSAGSISTDWGVLLGELDTQIDELGGI